MIVALERNAIVDLLPDRDPGTGAGWLRHYPCETGRDAAVRGPMLVQGDDGALTARPLARVSRNPDPVVGDADEGRGAVDVEPAGQSGS